MNSVDEKLKTDWLQKQPNLFAVAVARDCHSVTFTVQYGRHWQGIRHNFALSVSVFFKISAEAKSSDHVGSVNYVKITWFAMRHFKVKKTSLWRYVTRHNGYPMHSHDELLAWYAARVISRTRTWARLKSHLVIGWIWRSYFFSATLPENIWRQNNCWF